MGRQQKVDGTLLVGEEVDGILGSGGIYERTEFARWEVGARAASTCRELECAKAAVENGADAIYFGLQIGFNARARAANFAIEELEQLMAMLHRRGVLGYVTLNTLVFTDELPALEKNVRFLAASGVDAVLVQDLGAARLIRQICPDLPIHASTQMTMTCHESIEVAKELGVERVVLARELSIAEMAKISSSTDMPLEAFVHGALCVVTVASA